MRARPLLSIAGLCGGDYLLWSWSSGHSSQTLALVSGLLLPVLLLALASVLVAQIVQAMSRALRRRSALRPTASRPRPRARTRVVPRIETHLTRPPTRRRRRLASRVLPARRASGLQAVRETPPAGSRDRLAA